jgi:hypothetical protein
MKKKEYVLENGILKGFHTVEFFRDIRKRMYKATKNMSFEEEQEFFRKLRAGEVELP